MLTDIQQLETELQNCNIYRIIKTWLWIVNLQQMLYTLPWKDWVH